ncbi:MAG TPA: aldehyde dehydrogenase family protein [Casimicrobiaceae bacterium]|nr:aldehyde dehydrogenase family protein [Casimicrobiaceae bacterium]
MHPRAHEFYIDGAWRAPSTQAVIDVVDPATEEVFASVAFANAEDVDRAVAAARRTFADFAQTTVDERIALLQRIEAGFVARREDLCIAMSREMGVPIAAARSVHFPSGPAHVQETIKVLRTFAFDAPRGTTLVTREPIGVCALITPWNFPINQVACKVVPALAAGCTMVLKPSEISPISALVIAEILQDAGVPAGVFNLVNGDGATTGHALASHPDVDMVSFTGSTRGGIAVAKAAADTVKRVAQELGGKSANVLLDDAEFERAVTVGVNRCFNNSGQSCVSPTRMLVPRARLAEATAIAVKAAQATRVGAPGDEKSTLGPVASRAQFEKVQRLIERGIAENAELAIGGPGRPPGLERGFFVRPTIFTNVDPHDTIAREEIFGPVLCIIGYDDEDDAVRIANDSPYGLAAYVQSSDLARARRVARRLRAGNVQINYPSVDRGAPFGGYKQSGNGREWGEWGVNEFLEVKGIQGYGESPASL